LIPRVLHAADIVWINKDFKNTLAAGESRDDLEWVVKGDVRDAIVDTFTGAPFSGKPSTSLIPSLNSTLVVWSGGVVDVGQTVHVGLEIDKDKLPAGTSEVSFTRNAQWSQGGLGTDFVAGCATATIEGDPTIRVQAPDDLGGRLLDVFDYAYAVVQSPLPLSDLSTVSPG
jgi:hypothetical protein